MVCSLHEDLLQGKETSLILLYDKLKAIPNDHKGENIYRLHS